MIRKNFTIETRCNICFGVFCENDYDENDIMSNE
jgi:hypothetical protein